MKIKLKNDIDLELKHITYSLLSSRGVENIQKFLNPTKEEIQSYEYLINITKGVEQIRNTINSNRPYALIVDCDVDGFTSSAIIYQYLKRINPNKDIVYYVHTGKQHGLEDMWEQLQEENYDLIICPDSASNDGSYIDKLSCPVLILDHHELENEYISPNMIIVNNQISDNYNNKYLSGAGVTWQFCKALDKYYNTTYANDYIDLAAVGICGDNMSMLEIENQAFMKIGLNKQNIKNKFLIEILKYQSYSITKQKNVDLEYIINCLNPISLAFYVVPLINAITRVGTMDEKYRLFTAFIDPDFNVPCNKRGCKGTFEKVSIESIRECVNAKNRQNRMIEKAEQIISQIIFKNDLLQNKILLIQIDEDLDLPSTLNGLLAMRLAERYKRPTIVGRVYNGEFKGSIRNKDNSFIKDFKSFLLESNHMEWVQGHAQAAGFCMKENNINNLIQYSNDILNNINIEEDVYEVDLILNANNDNLEIIANDLVQYEKIWGSQNRQPIIYLNKIYLKDINLSLIGTKNDTLKFNYNNIEFILFKSPDILNEIFKFKEPVLSVIGTINLNTYNNMPQFIINKYEIEEELYLF